MRSKCWAKLGRNRKSPQFLENQGVRTEGRIRTHRAVPVQRFSSSMSNLGMCSFLRVWHMATALYSCSALGSEGLRLLPPEAAASPLKEFYEYTPWACTHKQELKRRCRGMSA